MTTRAMLRMERESRGLTVAAAAELASVSANELRAAEADSPFPPDPRVVSAMQDVWSSLDMRELLITERVYEFLEMFIQSLDGPVDRVDVRVFESDEALWAAHPDLKPLPAKWHRMVMLEAGAEIAEDMAVEVVFTYRATTPF